MEILRHFVMITKLHPILVNFTAALIPVSVFCDILANYFDDASLQNTAWWTLFFAVIVTPATALTGWLFWMKDDNGVTGMTIHKWLGTGLAVALCGFVFWRWKFKRKQQAVNIAYLAIGIIIAILLAYQGHLGGSQVFSGM